MIRDEQSGGWRSNVRVLGLVVIVPATPGTGVGGGSQHRTEGAVLYQIGLLFGELYEVPTGRAFSSRVRVCGCMIDGVAGRAVYVVVIFVVVVNRRRS